MKVRLCLTVLVVLSLATYSQSSWAQPQTPTGFYYPTGTSNLSTYAGWLARGSKDKSCNGGSDYLTDKYHLGKDIATTVGAPVYAISDGSIVYKSFNINNISGWGSGNIALVVKHKLSNGIEFLALYGHIRSSLKVGDAVTAGRPFATIGP